MHHRSCATGKIYKIADSREAMTKLSCFATIPDVTLFLKVALVSLTGEDCENDIGLSPLVRLCISSRFMLYDTSDAFN